MDVDAGGKSSRNPLPGLSIIASAIDVRIKILELVPIDARIGGGLVEVRRLDHSHSVPRGNRAWRHVLPVLSIVRCEMNQSVISPDPDQTDS